MALDEARLAAYLSDALGRPVVVGAVRRIGVGSSRAMYRVDSDAGAFVVRVEQGGVFGTSGAEEVRLMRGLRAAGVPVARVRWVEPTGTVLGQPFFVMDFVEGDPADAAMDAATAEDLVRTLAALHALDWRSAALDLPSVPASAYDATHLQVERWAAVYRGAVTTPVPLLEEARAWLHHHAPPLERLALVHGDAGPGNAVTAGGRVLALTDWEFAHLGDPAEDWSFCLSMRGARTMGPEAWRALFARVAGVDLSPARWAYWEAFNLFKGACANLTCLDLFERGVNPAPDMAAIGTSLHLVFLRRLADVVAAPLPEDLP